jgi:hypothetical protein
MAENRVLHHMVTRRRLLGAAGLVQRGNALTARAGYPTAAAGGLTGAIVVTI